MHIASELPLKSGLFGSFVNVKLKNLTLYQVFLLNLLFLSKDGPYFVGVGGGAVHPASTMVTGQDYGSGKTQMYIDVSKLAAVFEKQPGITESLLGFYVLAAGPYAVEGVRSHPLPNPQKWQKVHFFAILQ